MSKEKKEMAAMKPVEGFESSEITTALASGPYSGPWDQAKKAGIGIGTFIQWLITYGPMIFAEIQRLIDLFKKENPST